MAGWPTTSALVRTGDVLWALTIEAELILFRDSDKQFESLARYKVGDTPTWAHPVIATGSVIVKDETKLTNGSSRPRRCRRRLVPIGPRRSVDGPARLDPRSPCWPALRPWQAAASVNNGAQTRPCQ